MANKTISGIIQNKIDTSTNFTTNNPILASGQFGVESDTNKIKMGNGTSTWNDLEYISGDNNGLKYTELPIPIKDSTDTEATLTVPIYYSDKIKIDAIQNDLNNINDSTIDPSKKLLGQLLSSCNMPINTETNGGPQVFDPLFAFRIAIAPILMSDTNINSLIDTFSAYTDEYLDIQDMQNDLSHVITIQYQQKIARMYTVNGIFISIYKFITDGKDGIGLYIDSGVSDYFIQVYKGILAEGNLDGACYSYSIPSSIQSLENSVDTINENYISKKSQTLTDSEKARARTNIGAGTSSFSGSYNDLTDKPDISPNLYDLIITSQTEFESFCSSISNSTCTAASVLFVGDGGDLEFTKSDGTGIQLPTTLKIISGINNAIINLGSISTNGLYYETRPTSNDYSINNITIKCSSSTAGNDAVISNCINLTNVTALSIGSVATLCPSAFKNCYYLNYCIANGAAMSAYDNCRYLHDCRGTSTGSYASSDTYSFCTYLDGCYGDSNASTYYNCTNLVGCRSNSGYRGFYNCKQVKSCSSTASYRSYADCYNLYDCEANRSSSTSTSWYGFENCDRNVFPHFPFGGTQIDINKLTTGTVNNTIFIDNYDSLYKFYDSTGTQQTIASLNDIPEVPSLTNYVTTNTSQTITAVKYFDGLIHFLGETNNLDNITSQNRGITISSFAGGISTAPTTDSSGIVINYYVSNTYRTQLVLMNDEQASTWRRSYINGNWTVWKQISGNNVDIGSCTLSYSSTNSALEFNFD